MCWNYVYYLLTFIVYQLFFSRWCTGLYRKAVIFSCNENVFYLNKWTEGINLLSLSNINFKTFSISSSQNYNNLFNAFFRSLTHSKKHAIKLFWVVSCHYKNKTRFSSFSGFLDLSTSPHQASAQSLSQALKRDNFPHLLREFKRLRTDSSDAHVLFEDFRKQTKMSSLSLSRSQTFRNPDEDFVLHGQRTSYW